MTNFTVTKVDGSNTVQDPSCRHVGNRVARQRQRQVSIVIHFSNFLCAGLHKLPALRFFKIPKSYLEGNSFVFFFFFFQMLADKL